MSWRFRKSIKIAPGVRINFGKSSTSLSIGGKGFHRTYSSTGRVTDSIGIPGTGISYTTTHSSRNSRAARSVPASAASSYARPAQATTQPQPQAPAVNPAAIRAAIAAIYRTADTPVDWKKMLVTDDPSCHYFKQHAEAVLNGDIDAYFTVINDLNPLDDLMQYGSGFECGTDDPRKLSIHFHVNSDSVLRQARSLPRETYNDLLQDYVCGCAIRIARDMFALLPIRSLIVDAWDHHDEILSVDFGRRPFLQLDFANLDPSDTIEQFEHRMDFEASNGFSAIVPIDDL
ncbi:DUF4236 domain-containing protein [uncultured Mitsuokella sp.]|uniref:DUF4236 domain-containing protein n=1 Tax=uncultured Mitsuokella sp. TaxID=453120 RepID=UPI0026185F7C|nr:DUF4236 domain-containing protein [uncultured Mitsuokella sp.]